VRSFHKSRRDQLAEARAGNEFYRLMFAPDKPPQIVYAPEKPKRERRERDPTVPSEHQSQAAVISWWRLACTAYQLPEFALFAIPNGGARNIVTGSRLKQEGVRAGVLDLMLAVKRGNYGGLFIEMKKFGNKPSEVQREVIAYLHTAGYQCDVCWGAEGAIATISNYLKR
jgi:hypothetical protein